MGSVWKVRDRSLNQLFAAKVINPEILDETSALKRFEQEAQAVASLTHENLVSIYDTGSAADGSPYLVMDFLGDESLESLLEKEVSLPVEKVVEIASQITAGLIHAHSHGVVHRDLKPSNVMLRRSDDGTEHIKIVDFGIAKLLPSVNEQTNSLTQTTDLIGSPAYMSPEQCQGDEVDPRSDIYSLGCLIYKLISGNPPFESSNQIKTILGHINKEPEVNKLEQFGASKKLLSIIEMCLQKDPDIRYQSAEALAKDLDSVKSGKSPNKPVRTLSRKESKNRNGAAFTGIALMVGAIICFFTQLGFIERAEHSKDWPVTTGTILVSTVRYPLNIDGTPNYRRSATLNLGYEYKVNGKDYTSKTYQIFGPVPPTAELEKVSKSHPEGSQTRVFYNPDNPSDACLKPGTTISNPRVLAGWTSGALFMFGLLFLFIAFGDRRILKVMESPPPNLTESFLVRGTRSISKATGMPFAGATLIVILILLLAIIAARLLSH